MPLPLKHLSIRQKLIALMMAITACVLTLATLMLLVNEAITSRREVFENLSTIAMITGYNAVAPLTFNDPESADENLASLAADSSLWLAQIYRADGSLFAQYNTPSATGPFPKTLPPMARSRGIFDGLAFVSAFATTTETIQFDGEILGTVYLKADLGEVRQNLLLHLTSSGIILLISLALAYIISRKLQGVVSGPIMELTHMMNHVSDQKDYSIRANTEAKDEIGRLMHGFNEMLTQIQVRDRELVNHQEHLEELVNIRTEKLKESLGALQEAKSETDEANESLKVAIGEARHMAHRAEEANKAKSRFLANMSHEIRTPMNGVMGMTHLLMGTPLNHSQAHHVQTIRSSADALLTIINDILDFSKIESGKLEVESIGFHLLSMMESINEIMAIKAQSQGLEYIFSYPPDLSPHIIGDPSRLRQVLVNLVSNAIKFTKKGEIRLSVELQEHPEAPQLRFSVADTGIGMADPTLKNLFSPFSQADVSTTRKYGGTGLGLAISKQLVELMGGEIKVESILEVGSRFWFTFPLKEDPSPLADPTPARGEIRGARILIMDDNPAARAALVAQLHNWDCHCIESETNGETLELIKEAHTNEKPIDVAIIDNAIPGEDCLSLAQSIHALPETRDVSLVLLATLWQRGDANHYKVSGYDAYLTKPCPQSSLYNCLTVLLGKGDTASLEASPFITRHTLSETKRKSQKILLVEDFPINQEVALGILASYGFQAQVAENGREAVEALKEKPFDFVFMDLQMPEMDGLTAARIIRNPDSGVLNPNVPIVAMTANAMKGDREKCLEAGMNDHIPKPIMPEEIYRVLQKYLLQAAPAEPSKPAPDTPPEPQEEGLPIFDRDELMARVQGNESLFNKLKDLFVEKTPEEVATLKGAMEKRAMEEVRAQAHKLKGYFANISAKQLTLLAEEMQIKAEAGEEEACQALTKEIEEGVVLFEEQLKKEG